VLTARVIDSFSTLEALEPKWTALLERADNPAITQTPAWLCTWWRIYGKASQRQLRAVTLSDERGNLVALAPLLRRPVLFKGVPVRSRLELLATGEPEQDETCSPYVGVLVDHDRRAEVATRLVEVLQQDAIGKWDELVMPAMAADDAFLPELEGALARAGLSHERSTCGTSALIELPKTWDEYLSALKGSRRYFVRRTLRDLEKFAPGGDYALEVADTPEQLRKVQPMLYELHEQRWALEDKPGVFCSVPFRRFHESLMASLDGSEEQGRVEVLWLTVRGEPTAVLHNFVYRGRVYFYQSGRRTSLPKQIRPGIALHLLAMQRAIDKGWTHYDFLEGARMYKAQLAQAEREQVELRVIAPTLRAKALDRARSTALRTASKLRTLYRDRMDRSPAAGDDSDSKSADSKDATAKDGDAASKDPDP